ncbi:MAG: chromate efflux transporter [Paracoccaceae bacterium]
MITIPELFRIFGRIGLLSFGGPAAQIALMHRSLVDEHKHLTEKQFLGALSFCMLLPGPEAMQLATYSGWRLRGTLGGVIAGLLFVLPGAAVILALAFLYAAYGQLPLVQSAFLGIKAAVIVIVIQALVKIGKKSLTTTAARLIAALSFLAIYMAGLPFPLLILVAGIYGFASTGGSGDSPPLPRTAHTLRTITIWAALWAAPLLYLRAVNAQFLTEIGLFFAKLAVVTFGGAYAVLAYMAQTVVDTKHWLSAQQMIDALGLAETTPGPLILVTEFVALLAGMSQGGPALALAAGATALWMTFIPCFLWIFTGAPYVEWILSKPRLSGALAAISAAVTGVILNLSLWFALHVLFTSVSDTRFGAFPEFSSFQPLAFILTLLAVPLLTRLPMIPALAIMALAGLATGAIF